MTQRTRNFVTAPGAALGVAATLALAALGFAAPAAADWLVTRDGARIETKGAWRVDGKRVLFDLPNGTLSTIRVDEVDLDLSAVATAEARNAAAQPTPVAQPKREPVLRLTEKEHPPVGQLPEDEDGAAENGGAGDAAATEGAALEVISWEKTEIASGDGVEIFGTIRNNSPNMITSPSVMVAVYDADGGLLATNNGLVNSPQVAAGKTANFRVEFSGLTDFAAAKFDAQGRGFKQRTSADGQDDGEEGESVDGEEQPIDLRLEPEPPAGGS